MRKKGYGSQADSNSNIRITIVNCTIVTKNFKKYVCCDLVLYSQSVENRSNTNLKMGGKKYP